MIAMLATVTPFTEKVGVPLLVAIVGLIAAIAAAAISFVLTRLNDTIARRREGYATATKELIAWAEYPYRVRRRTGDTPETLDRLVACGHELQEALRYRQTWIATEDAWVSQVFAEVRADITAGVGPASTDAWTRAAITAPAGMNLNGWRIDDIDDHIARLENAITFRFGWRRIVATISWHPGAHPRPTPATFTAPTTTP